MSKKHQLKYLRAKPRDRCHLSVVTFKHSEKILHLLTTFKTSKKGSSQRKRQTDGMYSNKWVGVMHVKHMSNDNNNNKKKQIKVR